MFEYEFLPVGQCLFDRIQITHETISFFAESDVETNPFIELSMLVRACAPLGSFGEDDHKHNYLPSHDEGRIHIHLWFANGVTFSKLECCLQKMMAFQDSKKGISKRWGWLSKPLPYLPEESIGDILQSYERYLANYKKVYKTHALLFEPKPKTSDNSVEEKSRSCSIL